ncbi:hypothetical protein ANAPRD1_00525 [Anaplasma phagocytophilum]|nr:hypothetical protein ANAPRD1_00525 [Anaplasma phagocytophilum]SCV64425.1 hypothetical protein ANAPH1_00594 [Anaplasma phagocytophilum]
MRLLSERIKYIPDGPSALTRLLGRNTSAMMGALVCMEFDPYAILVIVF